MTADRLVLALKYSACRKEFLAKESTESNLADSYLPGSMQLSSHVSIHCCVNFSHGVGIKHADKSEVYDGK